MGSFFPSNDSEALEALSTLDFFQNKTISAESFPATSEDFSTGLQIPFENIAVMPVYPPTQEPSMRRLFITMYLIVCLTVGICGNFSQLALQYYSYRLRIYKSTVSPNCTQLYICLLHIVYFLISISLPSVIIENLVQIWMFGMFTCASHIFLITTGRTAAAWLTVMLFLDQWRVHPGPDLLVAFLYFLAYSAHWVAVTWVFIGVTTPEESALLGDLATIFPYTLPAVVWLPLSFLSSSTSAQARFYDISGSARIHDPQSEISKTFKGALKQTRNTRWSIGDIVARPEITSMETGLNQQIGIPQSISSTASLYLFEKSKKEQIQKSKTSSYIHSSKELDCDFKSPCAWNNVESDSILDTSDFYTFEKKDEKTFPVQIRPGSVNPKQGTRFILAGNTTSVPQSAVLVSAPIACQVTKGKLRFKYWLYNAAKIEVVVLKVNPSHGHLQVKYRPKTDCHFLKHTDDECIVEIDEMHEPFKIGIRSYQLHDSSVGSFAMLGDIRYAAQICREHEVPSLFGGIPVSSSEPSSKIIETASQLNCKSNVGACNWKPTYPGDTTNVATLRSLWQTGINQRFWDEFVQTTDDSHPEGDFLFQYIDPMSTLPIGQLQSATVPCTQAPSSLQFRYWMSPNVQAQLCTVTKANVSLSCVFLSEANSPGPITIDIDRGDKNPFKFVFEVIRFDTSRTSVFAIDDIVFKSILCHEEAPKTTPAPLGIGAVFELQPFPDVSPSFLPSKLDCNFEIEQCNYWENLDGGFQAGFIPTKLPFEMPKHFRGNAAVAYFTSPDSFAVLQSPVISCAQDARITVKYFSSIGSRLSVCAEDRCLKERERTGTPEENNPSNFGHSGELSVNVTSVKNFRLSIVAESYAIDGGVFPESFVIIKEIITEGHLCRMKDRTELACEALFCDFRKGTLCNYQSALTSSDDIPFQHDSVSGITASLSTVGRRRVVLRSPEFQLSRPADLKFKLMLSTYGAEAYICPDEFVDNLTEDCELVLGPKIDERKFESLQVQLDPELNHFAIIAFHDKDQQFGEADVAITDIQLVGADGSSLCNY
ncbi:hypothetical protein FO519_005796 [Halicephalobus sp. NKZ332]|nr:hypothetical protein FO519_005796 [Halicephalobus sp. NKZ332]